MLLAKRCILNCIRSNRGVRGMKKRNRTPTEGLFKSTPTYIIAIIVLLALIILSLLAAVTIGSVRIPIQDVYHVLLYKLFGIGDAAAWGSGSVHDVVWFIRLPRLILALGVGMGLAICGVVMQAIVKNPLADPYILGVSSGASLGATLAILLGVGVALGSNYVGIVAFLGAFGISVAVVILANIGGKANSVKLLLAGMALSAVCSAFSNFIVYFANDKEGIQTITYWLMGSLAGASWENISFILPITLFGTFFFLTQFRTLNLMLLGDDVSVTLGTDLHRWRQVYLLVSSLMIGFIVYSSGMIGFVGLIIPHVVRMLFGTDHKKLVPLCALTGALFLIWADVLCRVIIQGMELPIGILTSMIGAPCFIWLMVRRRYGFGGGD